MKKLIVLVVALVCAVGLFGNSSLAEREAEKLVLIAKAENVSLDCVAGILAFEAEILKGRAVAKTMGKSTRVKMGAQNENARFFDFSKDGAEYLLPKYKKYVSVAVAADILKDEKIEVNENEIDTFLSKQAFEVGVVGTKASNVCEPYINESIFERDFAEEK